MGQKTKKVETLLKKRNSPVPKKAIPGILQYLERIPVQEVTLEILENLPSYIRRPKIAGVDIYQLMFHLTDAWRAKEAEIAEAQEPVPEPEVTTLPVIEDETPITNNEEDANG